MEAVYKSGGASRKVATAETPLVLDRPSIVSLKIAPESVLKFERRGDDLVLVLRDGQEVAVRGFFAEYPDGGRNDLVLEDGAGVQWWGQYTAPWKDFHFTEIEWNDAGGALLPDGVPGWLLGALGVLGVGAAASGGGGGGGGGPAFIPPLLPPQNRGPEGKAEPVVTDQDKPVQGQVHATDPDRDALSYTVAKGPEHGTVTVDPSTGQFVYTPKPGYEGPDSFEVTVSDGKGGTTTVKVPVTVSPVNDAPTAPDYTETTNEDTPVSGRVTGSDIDSGDTLTYTKGSDPAHGTVTVNADGTYTYVPGANFNGTDSFTVTVSDGHGGTTTSTVNVTVVPVNDAPTAPDYTKTTNEDTPVSGQVIGTDVDGDTLTYTKGSDPAHGTVTVNADGTYTYTPGANFNGTDSFTVTVSDGHGGTTTSTVTVTIAPVNDAPVFVDGGGTPVNTADGYVFGYDENRPAGTVLGTVRATDVDSANVTYSILSGNDNGYFAIDPVTGAISLTAAGAAAFVNDYEAGANAHALVVGANDGTVTTNIPVTLNEQNVNDAPTAPGDTKTTNEDTAVSGQIVGHDADGDTLTYTKGSDPAHGTVTVNADGTYTYVPGPNFNGTDSFTVTVSDGHGGTTTSTVNVTVVPVNDAPTAPDYTKTTNEDTPVSGQVVGSDVDGDTLTYTKGSDPAHGTVTVNADGTYTYTPGANFNGTDSFTVTVSDGHGGTTTSTVNVTINPVNDAPVFVDGGGTPVNTADGYVFGYDENRPAGTVLGTVRATDIDSATVTYSILSGNDDGYFAIDPATGAISLTPAGAAAFVNDYEAASNAHTLTVGANDGTVTTVIPVTLNEQNVNEAPTAPNDTKTTNEDTPVSGQVVGSDVDGDALTYTKGSDPSHGTVTVNADGTYTYTPSANFNGTDSFTVTVSDGHGGTTTSTVTVTIDPVNDVPTVPNYNETTDEDTPVSGQVVGSDVDGDALTYTKGSDPAHGTVTVNADGTYTYTPGANFNGTDSFTVTVSDGHGGTTTSTVNVTINPVNDAPTAPNYTETTNEDTPVSGKVTGSDVDGDALTYAKGSDPAHGTVTVNADGTYTYVPGANFNGTDTFTVTVSDGNGGTTTSTVTVTIDPVNDAPTAPNYTETTDEDTPVSGQVVGSDVDGDTLTYTKGSDPAHGTVTVNTDGTYTYVPSANFNGTDSFTVTVSDGHGGTTTSTVTVTIDPVNDAPTAPDYTKTTNEDTPVSGQVVGTDVDGDTLTYVKGSDPTNGTVTVNADGTYTYVPGANFNGTDSFTVTVSDGHGGTTTSTVNVTINPVDDAPVFVEGGGGGTPVDTTTGYVFGYDENRPAGTVLGTVRATDVDSATITYSILSGNDNGYFAIDPVTGEISLTPAGAAAFVNDFEAGANAHALVVGANDGTVTTSIPVTLNEQNINDAPTVPDYNKTTDEDTPVSGSVIGSDVDGDTLTYAKGSNPAHGTVTVNADGTYTYTPGANFNGTDSFTVTVSDGHGGTTTSTVNVTINPVNDAPVFVEGGGGGTPVDTATGYVFGYNENRPAGTVLGTVRATDVDSATITYSILSGNDNGYFAIDPVTGAISLTAAGAAAFVNDYEAGANAHALVVGASDGTVTTNIPVTLNEQNVNEAPTAPNDTKTTNEDTPVSGQIVGSDVDGDTLTYAKGSNPSNGTVTVNANGTYTYVPGPNFNGTDSFTVTVSDGHGGTTTSTVNVTVTPVNDAPSVTVSAPDAVSEGSLPGGIPAAGEPPVQSTGTISIADPDSAASDLAVSLSGPNGVTSGGQPVTWTWDAGTHTLTGSVTVGGVTTDVMTVAVGNVTATGAGQFEAGYTVTLKAPIDHPAGNGEGVSNLQFQAHVTDGQTAAAPVSFDVPVKDDAPVLVNGEQSVDVAPINTNLMVILDLSGSMGQETPTRLSRAKEAVQNLIDGYDLYGDVRVQLVTFSSTGAAQQAWMTAAEAKTLVQNLQAGGGTNYDAALAQAMSGFSATGKLQGAQNVSYFLTDGEPTQGDGNTGQLNNQNNNNSSDNGIQAAEETLWKNFLTTHQINSFALGLGSSLNAAAQAFIDPIAYNGNTGTNTHGQIVTDTSQLNDMLQGTISVPPTVSNLLTGGLGGSSGFGADGGHVSTLSIDGTTYAFDSSTGLMTKTGPATGSDYSYNPATHQVTIATAQGGKLVVDFDSGEFSYQVAPRTSSSHNYDETLSYQVVDRDGDASNVATQTLHVNYTPAAGVAALFTSPDSLGLAGVDEVTVSIEQQQQQHDAPHFPFGDSPWGGMQLSDMLQGFGAAESLHALLQAAFPPPFAAAQASPSVLALASSADSLAAYAPPVAPSLDDELHQGLALHH